MAKPRNTRPRDYKAEEARRNAKAKALGFSSRAQMRRAQRHGYKPPRKTANPRSPIEPRKGRKLTPQLVQKFTAKAKQPVKLVTPKTDIRKLRRESQAWSNAHSRVDTSRYDPSWSAARVRHYHAAFVNPETRAWKIENGLDALYDFLVDDMGFYDDVEFDERYGVDIAV